MEELDFRDGVAEEMATRQVETEQIGMERGQDKYRLTGALWAKIVAFILLFASVIAGGLGLLGCIFVGMEGFYEGSLEEVLARQLRSPSISAIYEAIGHIESGDIREAEAYCRERNVDLELCENRGERRGEERVLWSTWDGYETKYITEIFTVLEFQEDVDVLVDGVYLAAGEEYLFRAYVNPDFPIEDNFRRLAETVEMVYGIRFALIGIAAVGILLSILMFIFLMCGAGHRNGRKGIVPGVLATIPFDVLTFLFGCVAVVVCALGLEIVRSMGTVAVIVLLTCVGAVLAVWGTLYCMEFAVRLKRGNCFRYSLIYMVLRRLWRMCRFLGRGTAAMLRDLPMVMTVVAAYLGLCIMEFLGILLFLSRAEELSILLWCMEKVVLFAVVAYIALACRKLLIAGSALAEGEADYKVDTSRLVWSFKEHGENLNSLGQGISKAVAERMRSERLKTELITNVSHDFGAHAQRASEDGADYKCVSRFEDAVDFYHQLCGFNLRGDFCGKQCQDSGRGYWGDSRHESLLPGYIQNRRVCPGAAAPVQAAEEAAGGLAGGLQGHHGEPGGEPGALRGGGAPLPGGGGVSAEDGGKAAGPDYPAAG